MNCTHPDFVAGLVQRCRKALPPEKSHAGREFDMLGMLGGGGVKSRLRLLRPLNGFDHTQTLQNLAGREGRPGRSSRSLGWGAETSPRSQRRSSSGGLAETCDFHWRPRLPCACQAWSCTPTPARCGFFGLKPELAEISTPHGHKRSHVHCLTSLLRQCLFPSAGV